MQLVRASAFNPQKNMVWRYLTCKLSTYQVHFKVHFILLNSNHDFHREEVTINGSKAKETHFKNTHQHIFEKIYVLQKILRPCWCLWHDCFYMAKASCLWKMQETVELCLQQLLFYIRVFDFTCFYVNQVLCINFLRLLVYLSLLILYVIIQGVSCQIIHIYDFVLKGPKPGNAEKWRTD